MSNDFVDDAKAEISGMAKDGMRHPSTKPVLTGAAVGAVAGLLLAEVWKQPLRETVKPVALSASGR